MAELKPKVTLKKKGEEAYVPVKQLLVSLRWTAQVDLDLMVFYKAKDGRIGGVFSENYSGGTLGNLNSFPFIQLSGDEGVGSSGGAKEETVRITKLDDLQELYICTINFTDASQNKSSTFNNYDAMVTLMDDKGENIAVPLDSNHPGTVAVIAKIDNSSFIGPKLVNENSVMDMAPFQSTIPGANLLQIASKIFLNKKGDSVQLKQKAGGGFGEIIVNLNWSKGQPKKGLLSFLTGGGPKGIDLDLGCLFELTTGQKGAVQPLGKSFGSFTQPPYIFHCGDDRTGAMSQGENLKINGNMVSAIKRIIVFTYIYEGIAKWSQTDGIVTIIQAGAPDIIIKLNEHRDGIFMCALALFENTGNSFHVKRLVEYFPGHRELDRAYNWGLRWVEGSKD